MKKTFQIKRSKWARGGLNGASTLLNYEGAMCCLGFYSKKLGAKKGIIRDVLSPLALVATCDWKVRKTWLQRFKGLVEDQKSCIKSTALAHELMGCNDDGSISESVRESTIQKLFKKLGWKVKFKD